MAALVWPTTRSSSASRARLVSLLAPSFPAESRCASKATPTTTSARGCPAAICGSYPHRNSPLVAEENIIAGNVILYGATSGTVHIRGVVGERFCVRNSGAEAVVEGVGDHACEYMTGGVAVVLGSTGRNFGAGMSGGIAYVLDEQCNFTERLNTDMVELEPLDNEDDVILYSLVERHLNETGSAVASRLLADWGESLQQFVKVMPTDYRRVLDAQRRAAEQGTDPVAAMMEAAHG